MRVTADPDTVRCEFAPPERMPAIEGSALAALAASLQNHAVTAVQALAVAELLLARQGASLHVSAALVSALLPRLAR